MVEDKIQEKNSIGKIMMRSTTIFRIAKAGSAKQDVVKERLKVEAEAS